MPRFHELTVRDVKKTIRDAVVVTLEPANGESFDFIQGQYLTFRRDFDGTEVRRSYSICAGRGEGLLQVGIKKVDGGAFSTWANEDLQPGMVLEAMEPMGSFHTPLDPAASRSYLGFAGGSGITPVLSILKTVLSTEPRSDFTLVYANRGVNSIMFREELEDLKNLYMGRLNIIHVLESDAMDIDLFQGRVDAEKCDALFEHWIDVENVDTAFICGPEPMMLGIAKALKDHGLTEEQIKFELFASAQPGRLARKATSTEAGTQAARTQATVTLDGTTRSFEMDKDFSVLDAALENALDAPYACKAGVCSTCKCRVIEGEVEMIANHALEDYEVERGYVLSCQSYPLTDRVVVDYDQ
ncbi:phenylacetate-CoA oxygenase/reductase subunit PaaK [Mameliella sp. AT18]|uniref:1,2-phenylacetyl-CoA epoxidase subunit PaaE n=1 Tax=Mameliella sp. AT18 TaxID=3028385 RepID=UPI000841001B|nr:1,2-phenylacetyl-CoA epoxidase subunit PaaE [Mameliella sp. AT18]MDD9732636.1 phenylacetate-CoA oxygenase/reductase subunit PaaK [Mameliella sp. AT18]ODM47281.1 phenylacetic acid degradation protein [Ruegeria sp. PBVC088]